MKKRLTALFLAAVTAIQLAPFAAADEMILPDDGIAMEEITFADDSMDGVITVDGAEWASKDGAMDSGVCGDQVQWTLYDEDGDGIGETLILSGSGDMADGAQLPDTMTAAVIGEGITNIGAQAFAGCAQLRSVTIAGSVRTIGDSAFAGCTALHTVTLPNGVTGIGTAAFSGCTALTQVTLPGSLASIGAEAFAGCATLNSIDIPVAVGAIGDGAFSGCSSLAELALPDGLTQLSASLCADCTALARLTVPRSVTRIGANAVSGTALTEIAYDGSEAQWAAITVDPTGNAAIQTAAVRYTGATYGHTLKATAAKAATCTAAGNKAYWTCSTCGQLFLDAAGSRQTTKAEVTIPATGHKWNAGTVTTEATCTTTGTKTQTCERCGATRKVTVDSKGHSLKKTAAKAATCTEAGTKEYWTCTRCKKVYSDANGKTETTAANRRIAPLGHKLSKTAAKAATCTAAGTKEYWTCTRCKKVYSDANGKTETTVANRRIAPLGHKLSKTAAKAATCTAAGTKEYWTCTRCKKVYSDANGKTETTAANRRIAPLGHKLSKTAAKAATCTKSGTKAYWTCTRCKKVYSDANGKTETTAAKRRIPALGHKLSKTAAKAATCTKAGHKAYWTCKRCDKLFSDSKGKNPTTKKKLEIPATGKHTYKKTITKATPSANGKSVKKCSQCGKTKTTVIYRPNKMTLSRRSYVYNGKAKKPSVKIENSAGKTVSSSHYTVDYPSNSAKVGTHRVTARFTGSKYSGAIYRTITVRPRKTQIKSVAARKNGLKIKWGRQTKQVTGYQLQLAHDSGFSSRKVSMIIPNASTASEKVVGLDEGRTYFIRIRTYHDVGGTRYFSKWSDIHTGVPNG